MSFYGTVIAADTYHADRGNADWGTASEEDKEAALTKASDYVDSFRRSFPGTKTGGRTQDREWPRDNDGDEVTDASGETIATDEVPDEVEFATYEGALLIIQGISLTLVPVSGNTTNMTRKRVKAGPIETETEYTQTGIGNERPTFQKITDLLSNVMNVSFGATVGLLRV